jgi:hypothetical protein
MGNVSGNTGADAAANKQIIGEITNRFGDMLEHMVVPNRLAQYTGMLTPHVYCVYVVFSSQPT